MSTFFQAWNKHMPKDTPDGCLDKIVTQFSKSAQSVFDLKVFFDQNAPYPELRFIKSMLTNINRTLKAMFFTPGHDSCFLIELIEKLWVDSESALSTVFKLDFYSDADEPMNFLLMEDHESA